MIRSVQGRPLRVFLMLIVGWIGLRLAAHVEFPAAPPTQAIAAHPRQKPTFAAATTPVRRQAIRPPYRAASSAYSPLIPPHLGYARRAPEAMTSTANFGEATDLLDFIRFTVAFSNRHFASQDMSAAPSPIPFAAPPAAQATQTPADRWQTSAWLLLRPNGANDVQAATVGRLGGSQAGLRIDYALAPRSPHRPAVYGRLTSALQKPAAPEAAVGLAIRPLPALPVSIGVERRIALGDGARNAMAAVVAGGFGPIDIAPGLQAEAYAQAGIVGFNRRDAFVDGRFALFKPIDGTPVKLGGAISGGAQPGVSRLDIGPEIQVRLPLPRTAARLSIEWRERIAGDAAPSSGIAITLAADF
ncbi:hypothetical protein [Sphingobium naphthae]|uniref:Lipid A deacylase LpxR family protein n=1 Tax=Sphingobium naphthae TaxID=1886786 RepID=A0ABU3ZR62_9SPHN|nr:hypothetical protein [Sphingobium naphthae]MDV5821996.1 hypothetical protein [Sphingobium naphthae]